MGTRKHDFPQNRRKFGEVHGRLGATAMACVLRCTR